MKRLFLFVLLFFSSLTQAQNEYMMAENYYQNNEFEKASVIFKKLVAKNRYNTTYLERLVSCYQETDNFLSAEKLLQEKLQKAPRLTYLNVLIGYNFEKQNNIEQANKYYYEAVNSIDKNPNYGSIIASFLKKYNKLNLAIKAYQKTSEKNKNLNFGLKIAQIYGEQGNFEQMFEQFINYVDHNKKYLNTVKHYSAVYITDDSENSNNILFKKALLRRSINNPKEEWNNLLSWLFIKQKEYEKAFIQLKAMYARDVDNLSGIQQLGNIAFQDKAYSVAKKCFDFFIERTNYLKDKLNAISKNLMIAVETKQPDIEQKFKHVFTEFGINENTLQVQLYYANYLTFYKKNPVEAKKVLETALGNAHSKYSKAKVKIQLANLLVFQNKFNKALIYFSQVQAKFKNHYLADIARFKVAQTSYFKNDFTWAKAQLKVLKGSATKLIANDAAELFLTISDNEPKDSIATGLAKYASADLLAYQNKNNEAIIILSNVITNFKGQPIEDEALFKQASLYIEEQKYSEAITNFNKIIGIDKKGIYVDDAYYNMAELYNNKLNNKEKAKEYYQKIIFEHPSSIYLVDARKKFRKLRGDNIE